MCVRVIIIACNAYQLILLHCRIESVETLHLFSSIHHGKLFVIQHPLMHFKHSDDGYRLWCCMCFITIELSWSFTCMVLLLYSVYSQIFWIISFWSLFKFWFDFYLSGNIKCGVNTISFIQSCFLCLRVTG